MTQPTPFARPCSTSHRTPSLQPWRRGAAPLVAALMLLALLPAAGLAQGAAAELVAGAEAGDLSAAQRALLADLAAVGDPAEGGATTVPEHAHPCVDGDAEGFPCQRVDLLAHLPLDTIGGGGGNDLWGWTDPKTGKEYALMGLTNGTAFVDISDPENPVYLGNLPTHTVDSTWRDIKTYQNWAYIVSEASGHGLQIFDLTKLRSVVSPPVTFVETGHYGGFGRAHNVVLDEETGFAYAVGSRESTAPFEACAGGLHMIDLSVPTAPTFAGCFSSDGYTHDAQCVVYHGPDTEHDGAEICFASNEDTLTIVDVSDKGNPLQLSRTPYAGAGYTHQGWLTEDHAYFLLDDELDESNFGHNTRTYIWDLTDLETPTVLDTYTGPVPSSDHNQYVKDGYAYQANYRSGLRILSLEDVAAGVLTEVAFFDIHPASDASGFQGAWSVYPFFDSGVAIVSGIGEGLFVLQPILCTAPGDAGTVTAVAAGDQVIDLEWSATPDAGETFDVYRSYGSCPGGSFERVATGVTGSSWSDTGVSGQVEYSYTVSRRDPSGLCESAASACVSATTTGPCTAPPVFAGVETVGNPAALACGLELSWSPAAANCGGGVSYSVYRGVTAGFVPAPDNRIAEGLTGTTYLDGSVAAGPDFFFAVRATDAANGAEDPNLQRRSGRASGPLGDGPWNTGAEIGDPAMTYSSSAGAGGGAVPEHVGWEFATNRIHSGDRSYYSTYSNGQCTAVTTPPLTLSAGETSELRFWSVWDIEDRWDGGVVQISDDGGMSWQTLGLAPDYPGTFRSSSDACGFATDQPSFTGLGFFTWAEYTADLSAWQGSEVLIRWIFSTDGGLTGEGWYVDDVSIQHTQVPGSCTSGAGPIFGDGFESGDLAGWTKFQLGG